MTDDAQTRMTDPTASTWYLRIDDGSVFGPVETETLRLWAQQGRVAPGNAISVDRTNWYPAKEFEGLEMQWLAELSNGTTYGPLNIRALEELISTGTVMPDAALENIRTGEKSTPWEKREDIFYGSVMPPEFDRQPAANAGKASAELGEDVGEVARELAAAIALDEGEQSVDHHSLEAKISQFESTLKRTMTLLRVHQRELEKEREDNQEIRTELDTRNRDLAAVRRELTDLRQKQEDDHRRASAIEKALMGNEEPIATLLARELEEEQAKSRTLEERAQRRQTELGESLREDQARCKALARQLAAVQEALDHKSDELEKVQARVEETGRRAEAESQRVQSLEGEVAALRRDLATQTSSRAELMNALQAKDMELEVVRREAEEREETRRTLAAKLADAEQTVEVRTEELQATRNEVETLQEESEAREHELLEQVNALKRDVTLAASTLETLKVDLRKAQEGALDAQKTRQALDQERQHAQDLETQNAALRTQLEFGQVESSKQFELAKQKIDDLQRAVEEFEETKVITPELLRGSQTRETPPSPLEDLEAQAQRELRAWQKARKR